jgi:glucoamylase
MILDENEYNAKIKNMIKISRKVIEDSVLDNGAIVAANATKEYYPSAAKNYFYVWPRDASYTCVAADLVGIENIQEKFFNWCLNRAEGFKETGLFYEKYYVNGLKALGRFQPDQTGTVLYAVWHHCSLGNSEIVSKFEDLIIKSANGLCDKWNGDCFDLISNDLWEERLSFPDLEENFTYSLAACIKGLECANSMIPNDGWTRVSRQMKERLEKHFVHDYSKKGYFVRSFGKLIDEKIDASMLGLVYPFEVYKADEPRIISTVGEIEKRLITDGGVHRYEFDEYDGWMHEGMHRKKGAGAWPLLNFWLSIYYSLKDDKDRAKMHYEWVLNRVNDHIPEQIFNNRIQTSICPLVWSHAMFIIASKMLGYEIDG